VWYCAYCGTAATSASRAVCITSSSSSGITGTSVHYNMQMMLKLPQPLLLLLQGSQTTTTTITTTTRMDEVEVQWGLTSQQTHYKSYRRPCCNNTACSIKTRYKIHKHKRMYAEWNGPSETKPNPENCKNCSSKCAYDCVQLQYTIQHRTVLIISPLNSRQTS